MDELEQKETRAWRLGYAIAWSTVLISAGLLAVCDGGPLFPEIDLRAAAEYRDGLRVRGVASVFDVPLESGAVAVTAFDNKGQALGSWRADVRGRGQFSIEVPGSPSSSPVKLELALSSELGELRRLPGLSAMVDAALAGCGRIGWHNEPRCYSIRGVAEVSLDGTGTVARRRTDVPVWVVVFGAGSVLCGLFAPILEDQRLGVWASLGVCLATVIAVFVMLGLVVAGYVDVLWNHQGNHVLVQSSIGYLMHGTFHEKIPPDLLFSLSLPRSAGSPSVVEGFGAPLWAIVVGMIGASVGALQFLVRTSFHVKSTVAGESERSLRGKADQLLAIVFAPLGSIYVYQSLIDLGATHFVGIASGMLASGLVLNRLMHSVSAWVALVSKQTSPPPPPSPPPPKEQQQAGGSTG